MLRSLLLIAALLAGALATDCYNYNGEVAENWLPCNPDQPISPCCSNVDYCLSNGICLDSGANNFYTQQGCTDPTWNFPCRWYCEKDGSDGAMVFANYSRLWICPSTGGYCCGETAECCGNAASTATVPLHDIVVFSAVSHPPEATAATATATAPSTETATTTEKVTATASVTAACYSTSDDTGKSLRLGLGIGLPVGVVCVAAALAAGFFWGRRTVSLDSPGTEKPAPVYEVALTGEGRYPGHSQVLYPVELPEQRPPQV